MHDINAVAIFPELVGRVIEILCWAAIEYIIFRLFVARNASRWSRLGRAGSNPKQLRSRAKTEKCVKQEN